MNQARAAAAVGNYDVARAEQRKAEYDHQRAAERARNEERLPPHAAGGPAAAGVRSAARALGGASAQSGSSAPRSPT